MNKQGLARTQEEIVARIEKRASQDVFGWEWDEYALYLDLEHVRPFLKDPLQESWNAEDRSPRQKMIRYMPFAWEEANNCRGIPATRSLFHYVAWLWLDGDDTLWPQIWEEYEYYGKERLRQVCAYLGLDADQWDDGRRVNLG